MKSFFFVPLVAPFLFVPSIIADATLTPISTDVWAFDTSTLAWVSVSQGSTIPPARTNGAGVADGDLLYLFGMKTHQFIVSLVLCLCSPLGGYTGSGGSGGAYLNDMWVFNTNFSIWQQVRNPASTSASAEITNQFSSTNDPSARWKFTFTKSDSGRVSYLWGGVGVGGGNECGSFRST